MNPLYKKEKLFILSMVLWGLVQLACGLFILVSEMGYRGHNFNLNNPIFVVAVSASYITAGKCTIAFTYFRGKALMVAVFVSSALSIVFGAIQFISLVACHHGKMTLGYDIGEESVHLEEGTIETVICLGSIFNAVFLFVFLRKCRSSTAEFLHLEEETDSSSPPPAYDTIERGNQESNETTSPPPIYTNDDWTRYQANIDLAWQGDC